MAACLLAASLPGASLPGASLLSCYETALLSVHRKTSKK
jgi:hypothetical protein